MYNKLVNYLSKERLKPYIELTNNSNEAIDLYEINVIVSHSLYVLLQFLEIGLRNKINNQLISKFGEEWYFNRDLILGEDIQKGTETVNAIKEVVERIKGRKIEKKLKDITVTNNDVISNMSFGFWVNLFCGNYQNTFWNKSLKHLFKNFKRKELNSILNKIRILRNRVFHHESIITDKKSFKEHLDLVLDMLKILYDEEVNLYIYNISDLKRFINRIYKIVENRATNNHDLGAPLN